MTITQTHMVGTDARGIAVESAPAASAQWMPSLRYPDPAISILHPSFEKYRLRNASVERLATGMRWCEGPVWFGDGRFLLWSDIANDSIIRYEEETGAISVFRRPSNKTNGMTRDRQGRLICCEHAGRRVTRTEYDGEITVLIDRFEGKRLNSPNDVVVKSDDSIWFTDPHYGISGNYNGVIDTKELPTNVYRLDKTGQATVVAADLKGPDGLAFSPDESKLYIIEDDAAPQVITVYDVVDDGTRITNRHIVFSFDQGGRGDGLRVDVDGNLWCGWGGGEGHDGVMILNSAGMPIGHIDLPERCANVCFGGFRRSRLFMAASHSLYSVFVRTQGAPGG